MLCTPPGAPGAFACSSQVLIPLPVLPIPRMQWLEGRLQAGTAHHPSWRRSPTEGLAGWQPTLPYPPTPSSQSLPSGRLQIWISVAPTLPLDTMCTLTAVWEK